MDAAFENHRSNCEDEQSTFHLVSVLTERADTMRGQRKRVRSRARILAATAQEMERIGYEDLTVDHIAEAAGIARGTFYLHYPHRSDAAMAVIRAYSAILRWRRPRHTGGLPVEDAVRQTNAYYVATYAANARIHEL